MMTPSKTLMPICFVKQEKTHMPETKLSINQLTYRYEILTTVNALMSLYPLWQNLYLKAPKELIFASPDWVLSWVKTYRPKTLFVVAMFNEDDELISVVPLMIKKSSQGLFKRTLSCLRFIGDDPCLYDQVDVLMDGTANLAMISKTLAQAILLHKDQWNVLEFNYLANLDFMHQLSDYLSCFKTTSHLEATDVHITTALSGNFDKDFEGYLKAHPRASKKYKREKKLLHRDYPEGKLELLNLSNQDPDFQKHLLDLSQKHQLYWAERNVTSIFKKHQETVLFYASLPENSVYLSLLLLDGKVISYDLGLKHLQGSSCQIIWYNAEYARYSPGFIHLGLLIENRMLGKDTMYSFGRGEMEYKTRWEDSRTDLYSLTVLQSDWVDALIKLDNVLLMLKNKMQSLKKFVF